MTSSEAYILNKISFIEQNSQYSLKTTKEFKDKFLKTSENFDSETYKVVSWDVTDLCTNIDVDFCIELLIDHIFDEKNEQKMFPPNPEGEKMRPENFRVFIKNILKKI